MIARNRWIMWGLCHGFFAWLAFALAAQAPAEELVFAFTLDTPPYVMDEAKSGIEIDIVRAALHPMGYTFTVRQMPYGQLADAVVKRGVDAAVAVTEMDDGTYYSENCIAFKNVAITQKSAGLTVDSIADLKGKTILAWQNAYEDLGSEFQELFSPKEEEPYRGKYREIANQAEQVELFWKAKKDVIVIDERVMKWFTKELDDKVDTSEELVYHRIFADDTLFRVNFKREQVRDDFNAGLSAIRENGRHKKIHEKYVE